MDKFICPECGKEYQTKIDFCEQCNSSMELNNRFTINEVLGRNVGITYLATDNQDGGKVIIKELSLRTVDNWKTEELFNREADILKQLHHPKIPKFIDKFSVGIGQNQRVYIVQQFFTGVTLEKEFETRRYTEKEILETIYKILQPLEYMHNLKPAVIHRDLKPSNLVRLKDNSIAIIDFGSVKDIVRKKSNATISGTVGFMAPEQYRADAVIQSDIYSVGVIAVVMLSRQTPEDLMGDNFTLDWKSAVGDISFQTSKMLEKFLSVDPKSRPLNATSAINVVKRAIDKIGINFGAPKPIEQINAPNLNQPIDPIVKRQPIIQQRVQTTSNNALPEQFYSMVISIKKQIDFDKEGHKYFKWKGNYDAMLGFGMIGVAGGAWYYYDWKYALGAFIAFVAVFMTLTSPIYKRKSDDYVEYFMEKMRARQGRDRELFISALRLYVKNSGTGEQELDDAFLRKVRKVMELDSTDIDQVERYHDVFSESKKGQQLFKEFQEALEVKFDK